MKKARGRKGGKAGNVKYTEQPEVPPPPPAGKTGQVHGLKVGPTQVHRDLELPDIDPFDFDKYSEDYDLLKNYFSGVELYVRLANFILYKYGWLPSRDRNQLIEEVETAQNPKKILENLTDSFRPEELLAYWYLKWNPDYATEEKIEKILQLYVECEDILFNRLYRKYVDEDWNDVPLWFAKCPASRQKNKK